LHEVEEILDGVRGYEADIKFLPHLHVVSDVLGLKQRCLPADLAFEVGDLPLSHGLSPLDCLRCLAGAFVGLVIVLFLRLSGKACRALAASHLVGDSLTEAVTDVLLLPHPPLEVFLVEGDFNVLLLLALFLAVGQLLGMVVAICLCLLVFVWRFGGGFLDFLLLLGKFSPHFLERFIFKLLFLLCCLFGEILAFLRILVPLVIHLSQFPGGLLALPAKILASNDGDPHECLLERVVVHVVEVGGVGCLVCKFLFSFKHSLLAFEARSAAGTLLGFSTCVAHLELSDHVSESARNVISLHHDGHDLRLVAELRELLQVQVVECELQILADLRRTQVAIEFEVLVDGFLVLFEQIFYLLLLHEVVQLIRQLLFLLALDSILFVLLGHFLLELLLVLFLVLRRLLFLGV